MKSIMCRAWDPATETMVRSEEVGLSVFFDMFNRDIMLCTGVHDKNNILIYEGDIITCKKKGTSTVHKGVIFWHDKRAGFYVDNVSSGSFKMAMLTSVHNRKVIGHTYQKTNIQKWMELLEYERNKP